MYSYSLSLFLPKLPIIGISTKPGLLLISHNASRYTLCAGLKGSRQRSRQVRIGFSGLLANGL